MTPRWTHVRIVALAAFGALSVVGCDDDDDGNGVVRDGGAGDGAGTGQLMETAALSSAMEVPPPVGAPNASGSFMHTLNEASGSMSYTLTVMNLTGPATAAHIHEAPPGMAGPIVLPLATPAGGSATGTAMLTAAQIAKLKAGAYYVNVHTAMNPSGEVRGQLDGM